MFLVYWFQPKGIHDTQNQSLAPAWGRASQATRYRRRTLDWESVVAPLEFTSRHTFERVDLVPQSQIRAAVETPRRRPVVEEEDNLAPGVVRKGRWTRPELSFGHDEGRRAVGESLRGGRVEELGAIRPTFSQRAPHGSSDSVLVIGGAGASAHWAGGGEAAHGEYLEGLGLGRGVVRRRQGLRRRWSGSGRLRSNRPQQLPF
ncbi:hypothetical protein C8R46DRAFT_1109048 [Mycena filopes]|nr:hypothetical protein C8R46DRAFT_1109048 [Mycena filopes]